MVRAMLCATHDRTSDAETSRRTRVDSDGKAAMGVDDNFEGIGATTFSMRSRKVVRDADNELFRRTIEKTVEKGILKGRLTAIIDSSPVHGPGAVADTYELIRGFMRQVVRAARERLSEAARAGAEPFCGAKPDIDWQDRAARKAHLGELPATGVALLWKRWASTTRRCASPSSCWPTSSTKASRPTKAPIPRSGGAWLPTE